MHPRFELTCPRHHHYDRQLRIVRGTPFYGFHTKEREYIRITLYNPALVKKVAHVLSKGILLQHMKGIKDVWHQFQPHEAHVPFLLQVLVDNHMVGMGFLHTTRAKVQHHCGTC